MWSLLKSAPRMVRWLPAAGGLPRPVPAAALVVRLVLGGLFLWAGFLKLSRPRAFAHVVDGFGLVPDGWPLVIVALVIPVLELLAGFGALLDRRGAYLLMLALLSVFIGVLWFGIINDLDVDCGCFSLEERRGQATLMAAFLRDWAMAAGAGFCLFSRGRGRYAPRATAATTGEEQQ